MKPLIAVILALCVATTGRGQTYNDSIATYRKQYIAELLADKRQPIAPSQADKIKFFPPDKDFCVKAGFRATPGSAPFMIPTHSGKLKPFRLYGVLLFTLKGTQYMLHAYQPVDMINDKANKDHLFIPFRDMTNYATTYGGGRYIDLSVSDVVDNIITLDFNKCYNPYCAYADGFNCPIPPKENSLQVEITAGEKVFTH